MANGQIEVSGQHVVNSRNWENPPNDQHVANGQREVSGQRVVNSRNWGNAPSGQNVANGQLEASGQRVVNSRNVENAPNDQNAVNDHRVANDPLGMNARSAANMRNTVTLNRERNALDGVAVASVTVQSQRVKYVKSDLRRQLRSLLNFVTFRHGKKQLAVWR